MKELEISVKYKGRFKLDYEESNGYVVSIDNIRLLRDDGEVLRYIEEPSRVLYGHLVDSVQNYIDELGLCTL